MGNQQSTSAAISDVVNKSMSNVLLSSSNSCSQNNSAIQEINFKDIKTTGGCQLKFSGISQATFQSPNFTCSSSSANSSDLSTKFKNELDQQAAANVSGLGGLNSAANSSTISNLKNDITNNINISDVSTCVQSNLAKNTMNFSLTADCTGCGLKCTGNPQVCENTCITSYSDISQNLTQSAVGSCMASNTNVAKVIADASDTIKQTSTASNTGIGLGGEIGIGASCSIIMIICILCIYFLI